MKTKILSLIYIIIVILFIVLEGQSSFTLSLILKASVIPVLIIIFAINARPSINGIQFLMVAGLFFSLIGDIILEFTLRNGNMFIIGLASFLIAHVMYFMLFFLTPGRNIIFNKRIILLLPVILYGSGILYFLYNDLNDMRIPVIIYTVIILIMLSGAINRMEKVNKSSFYLVLTGAILFVISDSAIAVNKFSFAFAYSSIIIMSTYAAAQLLIVLGYVKQLRTSYL
jgi:uncharacterized membrane protein YhhN